MSMPRRIVFALLVLAVSLTAVATAPAARVRSSSIRLTGTETGFLREMNRVRVANGLAALRIDGLLQRAARSHTASMLRSGTFDHGDFSGRMAQFGVRRSIAGENLAWGVGESGTPQELVAAWLQSPPHRANLLRRAFRRVGVGALVGSFAGYDGAVVVTTDFSS